MGTWPRIEVLSTMERCGVVPTLNESTVRDYYAVIGALADGGIRIAELCFRDNLAVPAKVTLDALYGARSEFPDILLGCGTVQTRGRANAAIDHGAQFIVSNLTDEGVIEAAHVNGVPVIPGARDDNAVKLGMRLGCLVVKILLLSGDVAGKVGFFKQFITLFPRLSFVPTGGITAENIGLFLKAGAPFVASGMMIPPNSRGLDRAAKIKDASAAFVQAIAEARSSSGPGL